MEIIIIIAVIALVGFGVYKYNSRDKKGEAVIQPLPTPQPEPTPVPEPTPIPEPVTEPIPTPDPTPEPIDQKPEDRVFHINMVEDGTDQTESILKQLAEIPNGYIWKDAPFRSLFYKVLGEKVTDWAFKLTGLDDIVYSVVKFPEGRFWTEGNIEFNHRGKNGVIMLKDRHCIKLEGHSKDSKTTLYTKAPAVPYESRVGKNEQSERRHIWLYNSSNIVIQWLRIEGSNTIEGRKIGTTPELTPEFWKGGKDQGAAIGVCAYRDCWEAEHAFDSTGSHNITIRECEVYGVWGDGFYAGNFVENPSLFVHIHDCIVEYAGRQGAASANARNIWMQRVLFKNLRRAELDLEPYSHAGFVTDVVFEDCIGENIGMQYVAAVGLGDVSRVQILNNTFEGSGGFVKNGDSFRPKPFRRSNWVVRGNVRKNWFGSPAASSEFFATDDVIFEDNIDLVSSKQSRNTILFDDCHGELIVRNNDFSGGIYVIKAGTTTDINIEGNTPKQEITRL